MPPRQKKAGRPPAVIPDDVRKIILSLIRTGESDRRVSRLVGMAPQTWKAAAARDKEFFALLEKASDLRHGYLAATLRSSMVKQIEKGHPWWAKLAIHNFKVLLKDPDVVSGAKIQRAIAKATAAIGKDVEYFETDAKVDPAVLPPGAVPPLQQPGAVPNSPGGPQVGQD